MARYFVWAGDPLKTRNLTIVPGQELPERWRSPSLMAYLRKRYGNGVIEERIRGQEKAPETVPVKRPRGRPRKAA